MESKRILLNCLPPTPDNKPGYSLSVIKSYLKWHGYSADVKYWNIFLRSFTDKFWLGNSDKISLPWLFKDLMPFFAYYAVKRNNNSVMKRIISLFQKYSDESVTEQHIQQCAEELHTSISEELKRMGIARYNYVYVQSKFYKYELISTGVFCEIVKEIAPNVVTIIEAQEFPRKAQALIDSFTCYDYATWGEYEASLMSLLDTLSGNGEMSKALNVVYKDANGVIQRSSGSLKEPIDLDTTPFADFTDYMEQTNVAVQDIIFPLESGRGCHWNMCSFCYMNDGYVYRKKSNSRMIQEINYYMDQYGAQFFYFIDNDLIGHNKDSFRQFLIKLKGIRSKRPLQIEFGEFIAKDLDADSVKLIGEAGFNEIQIGYESTSDKSLRLINKKSRFAHLILVSKWAIHYGIKLSYQNILRSMPFETDQIVLDNINNLYYLRFLLSHEGFRHSLRELCVVSTSRYFNYLSKIGRIDEWDSTPMQEYMVDDLIKPEYKYDVFLMGTHHFNPLWRLFKETERFYIGNNYSYEVTTNDEGLCVTEFSNGKSISSYKLSSEDTAVLLACEKEVKSIHEISELLPDISSKKLLSIIDKMKKKGLVYSSEDFSKIVSLTILSR